MNRLKGRALRGGWYYRAMTRAIPTILVLLVLMAVVSVGTLYAQGSSEGERPPYRIDLVAGWNLISFPGDPVDTAIESVIGPDLNANLVLEYAYDGPIIGGPDAWIIALRNADGEWTGALREIRGGRGHWVHTPVAETIEVALTTTTTAATMPPTPCGESDWRLEGVVDVELRPAGTKVDADDSLTSLAWRVAYGFDTAADKWAKIIPETDGILEIGAGYWVWVSPICGLVP